MLTFLESEDGNASKRPKTLHITPSKIKAIPHNTGAIVILQPTEHLSFFGKVKLRVYKGSVDVFGYTFHESSESFPLYATRSFYLSIDAHSKPLGSTKLPDDNICHTIYDALDQTQKRNCKLPFEYAAIIVLHPLNDSFAYNILEPILEPKTLASELSFIKGFYPIASMLEDFPKLVITEEYTTMANELLGLPPKTTLVCGDVNSGKSTFCRYLVNRLLTKFSSIMYLECDIGQTEFTPPGLISLNIVEKPIIGPPFTHALQPMHCYFVGDTSPSFNPGFYLDSLCSMIDIFRVQYTHMPLIINTCGWVKGMGYDLLVQFLDYVSPDFIMQAGLRLGVQAVYPVSDNKLGSLFSEVKKIPRVFKSIIDFGEHMSSKKFDFRTAITHSYFTPLAISVVAQVPYCVPWNKVRIAVVGAVVPPSQILYALNGTLVGLCVDHRQYVNYHLKSKEFTNHVVEEHIESYPKILLLKSPPVCECVGLGVIRAIDPQLQVFYVVTPVPPEQLQKVNTILRGSVTFHHKISFTTKQHAKASTPYITLDYVRKKGSGEKPIRRKRVPSFK